MKKAILRQCLQIAKKHNSEGKHKNQFRHYSFIIQDNKIIEWGINLKSDPLVKYGYAHHANVHAENEAYRKAKGILDKDKPFDCVNIRLSAYGEMKLSSPCKCCYNYLNLLGCRDIHFTTESGFAKIKCKD